MNFEKSIVFIMFMVMILVFFTIGIVWLLNWGGVL